MRRGTARQGWWAFAGGFLLAAAAATAAAQTRVVPSPPLPMQVITGENLGFRVEGSRHGRPTGRLVVKLDGEWVDVEPRMAVRPLTTR